VHAPNDVPKTQLSSQTQDIVAKALAAMKKVTPTQEAGNSQTLSDQTKKLIGKVAAQELRKPSPNLYQEVRIDELSDESVKFDSPAPEEAKKPTANRYQLPKPEEVLSS
jgi:hypothetical protein